ncbi:MAG: adenylosuccinate lyase, partial [Clostridia bacterium]|nr:adenylosuccinate lyase [Clostridia bacterium]
HSHAAAARVKREDGVNDLIDRIAADDAFPVTKEEIVSELDPILYVGRSVSQVNEFIETEVKPVLDRLYTDNITSELKV